MITDGKKWHYLAVKSLSALLKRITSKHKEDFYCLNCFHSYSTEKKLKKHEKVCNDHDYCYVEVKIISKNLIQKKKLSIRLLFIQCLQVVRLTNKKET